jgi:signal transduction histidine kinase/tetratricopeptide (TPR) repeat protein
MAANGHRRQVLLFLVAIILPCVVLVVLGLRIIAQERELDEKRAADERRSLTNQLRQELSARLDRIALEEATNYLTHQGSAAYHDHANPAVVLVAAATDGHLQLPWEQDPRAVRFRRLLEQGEFARFVARGERAEISSRSPEDAVASYTEAIAVARDPVQVTYARLLRGRTLSATGRRGEAVRDYEAVLTADLELVDEHGVPLALYAATKLLEAGTQSDAVIDRIRQALSSARWLSPPALYLLRDLSGSLKSSSGSSDEGSVRDLDAAISTRLACTEQAIALQQDLPRLGLGVGGSLLHNAEARWVPYGAPPWLVGRTSPLGGEGDIVVAVWADSLFAAIEAALVDSTGTVGEIVVSSGAETDGELLGAAFPGLILRFGSSTDVSDASWNLRRWFYLVALLLVLSVTLFGAYFLSRDVRRELRVAETRSRFVSAVSHELKTPLTAIRMFAETLQLGRSSDPETQTEYLETIVNESERLTRLLNNVLDFSKIERGKKEYRRTPSDLADIVGASARAMQYPLEQQEFTLNVEVQDELPLANVDRDAVEQAILNLLANAMKYSGDSRIIDLRLVRADGQAVIEVADRGVGIEPDDQQKIFDQFYRVPTKDNDGIPGTGLGLTLVRHIAEGHGGRVTVESTPGKGSVFAIHLPLEQVVT